MPKGYGLSEATKDAIWELRAQGLSDREIGRRLGLPRGSATTTWREREASGPESAGAPRVPEPGKAWEYARRQGWCSDRLRSHVNATL